MKNGRIKIVLWTICLLLAVVLTGCKNGRVGETYTEETKEVTDENGTHVVTYRYVDATKARGVDGKSLLFVLAADVLVFGLGFFVYRRAKEISDLKKRCTAEVSAVITDVQRSKGDRGIRWREWTYNARYRFSYKGRVFESRNDIYGTLRKGLVRKVPSEGDEVTVWIDPSNPNVVYDKLTEGAYRSYAFTTTVVWIGVVAILIIIIISFF